MNQVEQRLAAKRFAENWLNKGDEKQDTQQFWMALLQNVYGVEFPADIIQFEQKVKLNNTSYIDGYINETKVLIEQKSRNVDLRQGYQQSDGSILTPFQQARRYSTYLPHDKNPRWIVVCNFHNFEIHDMNRPNDEPEVLVLGDLEKEFHRLNFLVNSKDENIRKEIEVSLKAGELVGILYNELLKQYKNPDDPDTLKSLNKLCVRLVFCLYAEDAGLFGNHKCFHDYLEAHRFEDRIALIRLFKVLNTEPENRDPYLEDDLAAFPYVNGGLFADEDIEIPRLGDKIIDLILDEVSGDFDWSEISPTIFGAVFESTLNPETRRSGGMHYTSIENIHKVIDPLFLDDLKNELNEIREIKVRKTRESRLGEFQEKLAHLRFLDPAAGSGNFLTESYLSLRRLENEILLLLFQGQVIIGEEVEGWHPIRVSIEQFYGIEINDFAVSVALTALWIAESQMVKATENIVHMKLDYLPLKSNSNIVEGNALQLDWGKVVEKDKLSYIIGNPPFIGYAYQTDQQKQDLQTISPGIGKNIDYVTGWYYKASQMMEMTTIRTAFVSTNSITQGEQVEAVWEPLFRDYRIHIDFAYRTFRWDSEASSKAHVHCVIVGFSCAANTQLRKLYTGNQCLSVKNINAYLVSADDVFIKRRTKPICPVPEIYRGSQPTDDGNLILTAVEKEELLKLEPQASSFIRPFMMGKDFIDRKPRYCLWLVDANPSTLRSCPRVLERVKKVQQFRLNSKKAATRKKAETPTLFDENHECKSDYIAIPKVSSELRKYIPIDYLPAEIIAGDKLFMMPNASLYHFGVLNSAVHMSWMRAVAGRLKSDYSYSNTIVYNNFPWPNTTETQREKIEWTAQGILDARALYPNNSLADLYDERTMPPELRNAHRRNNQAVREAYDFVGKDFNEAVCVAELMKMYQVLVANE